MPTNTDRIDPQNNANPLARGDTNSTQNPTQDSSGEVGAPASKGVIGIDKNAVKPQDKNTEKPKDKDAA